MSKTLQGVFLPITTPFDSDGSLNSGHLAENVREYARHETAGYLILGSNGENKALTESEKLQVVETVIANKAPEQVAMVGSIYESTRQTIAFAKAAEKLGADYITLLPPSYFKSQMKDSVLIRYFTDVASAIDTPCILYKAPQFSGGVDLSPPVIEACAKHPNIAGIKDSSSSGIEKLLYYLPEDFAVLSGSINSFLSGMLHGATGGVISLANSLPALTVELYRLLAAGELGLGTQLSRRLVRANFDIAGRFGVAGVKCAMDFLGLHGDYPRLPLMPLSEEDRQVVKAALKNLEKPL